MTVYGVADVESARSNPARELVVGKRDIVTPLARELARDTGVAIVVHDGSPSRPPPPRATDPSQAEAAGSIRRGANLPRTVDSAAPEPLRPPSPALFRRGAPVHRATLPGRVGRRPASGRAERVVVVGAGHVGMITAMRIAEADVTDEVVLVDIAPGLAEGIALDITHTAALLGFRTRIRGTTSLRDAGPAAYVVVTAGKPRQPGMSRTDLVTVNAGIVGGLAREAAAVSPDAVLLIVTNPLDEMTQHAWLASGLPAERVIGMAGVLDSARFHALTGLAADRPATSISALALGSHGEEMVIPLSQVTVAGDALDRTLSPDRVDALVDRARNSGAEVVGLLKSGSAFFAPGASAARMVLAMIRDTGELLAATVRARGEYGIADGYVGLPVRLGPHGLREIVELPLAPSELAALRDAARRIADRVAELERAPVPSR